MVPIYRYAVLDGDDVVNVILLDPATPFDAPSELVQLPDDSPVGPGWVRAGSDWVAPPQSDDLE